jgi:O-antigen/teichoic acid export membrane protein
VARILGSEGYGQFGILRSTVLMFTSFAGYSLGITASKHVAECLNSDKEKTGRILGLTVGFGVLMGLLVGIVFYLLSPWLALKTLNAPEITGELRIGAFILFFSSLNGAQMGALQGFMSFKRIAKINVIQAIISFPLFLIGAQYFGVYGTIWAFAFSYILICILSNSALNNEAKKNSIKIDYAKALQEKSMLFTYSLPAFLSGLMVTPVKWYADSLLVSNGGFSEIGLFTAALTFNNIIMVGVGMLSAPFLSIMAKNKYADRNSKFSKFNIIAPWAMGIFFTSPFIVFPELGGYIFGDSFSGNKFELPFVFVLLFTIIIMFKQGLGRIMAVYNLQWWSFLSNLLWAICLIGSFLLFKESSAYTLSVSYLIAYIINVLVVLPVYYKKRIIPQKTIESIEAFSIWFLIFALALAGIYIEGVFMKLLFYVVFLSTQIFLFKRLLSK